jgi:hypothetical protein
MAYWMLVLTPTATAASLDAVDVALYSDFEADYEVLAGTDDDWSELSLFFRDDDAPDDFEPGPEDRFATIDRRAVTPGDTEIADMIEELEGGIEPNAGARWVSGQLAGVRCLYSATAQHHDRHDEALEALRAVLWGIQRGVGGLLYCDFEGYSNEEGDQITWELTDRSDRSGLWWVALRDEPGGWLRFQMDLADAAHRDAFRAGRVPPGVSAERVVPSGAVSRGR